MGLLLLLKTELETNPNMMEDPSMPGGDMKKNMN